MNENRIPQDMDLQAIQELIEEAKQLVEGHNLSLEEVYAEELVEYFSGEAPSGDTITLAKILTNQWLLLHEVIELSELKRMGYDISFELLFTNQKEVYQAHLTATEWELQIAKENDDIEWVKQRIALIPSWLEDPDMPTILRKQCKKLLTMYEDL
ncbi:MAG: hypothetical protein GF308_11485 [Candidatus Heimdallarchaeota archaeon]|nr:hypothetical protein [Candidatus Heimdallarchaeota archaeon]